MVGFAFSLILFLFSNIDFGHGDQILKNSTENGGVVVLEQANFGLPIRLIIPKINVNAMFESVGLTSDGAVGVPRNQDEVAWFNLGARPGEKGVAIISGHYGRINKKSSVFDDLHKLRTGDEIFVEDDQGTTISFVVRESRRYDSDANAPDVFLSNNEGSHLNLITCEGVWDEVTKSYPARLVVFADKE